MKPKVSWELLDRGSLRLRIISGDRDVSWTVGKTADLDRVYNVLEEMQIEINRSCKMPQGYPLYTEDLSDVILMTETVRTVDQTELDALREAKSKQDLANKANSFKLDGGNFWGSSDMDELDLYVLGTGEPE